MDAKVGDWVVTPRYGKAVEVNALWHRGLSVMSRLALRFGGKDAADEYRLRADRVRECFTRTFWNDPTGCLCDVVDGSHRDETVRPNQIFAVSLPGALLDDRRARGVVDVVERDLLTPVGLRSLSPRDSRYRGRYAGDVWSRDGAYHQGTVWAWLMGPFLTAYVKVRGGSPEGRERAGGLLSGMRAHLTEAGLGSISEIFDGDPPHLPRGCFAQAWSVAEVLRAYVEDVLGRVPGAR
jgi:glycogen debranching enzyme